MVTEAAAVAGDLQPAGRLDGWTAHTVSDRPLKPTGVFRQKEQRCGCIHAFNLNTTSRTFQNTLFGSSLSSGGSVLGDAAALFSSCWTEGSVVLTVLGVMEIDIF